MIIINVIYFIWVLIVVFSVSTRQCDSLQLGASELHGLSSWGGRPGR